MKTPLIASFTLILGSVYGEDPSSAMMHHHAAEANTTIPDAHEGHTSMAMPSQVSPDQETLPQPTLDPEDAEYIPYDLKSMDAGLFGMLLVDQLEARLNDSEDLLRWDIEGWYGGDFNRFWFKTEGDQSIQGPSAGYAEFQGYYGRLIAPFWDAQIGVRYDQLWEPGNDPSRFFAAIGLEGLSPYEYEVTPTLFISEDGDFSARLTATKELLITQRLIAQGRFETEIAAQSVPKFGVGEGFNYVELGLRLRYEIRREFAPYIGVNWERQLGETANLSRQAGEDADVLSFVAGVRLWF